jgi:tetraacyldisaccharide 4'-kinase
LIPGLILKFAGSPKISGIKRGLLLICPPMYKVPKGLAPVAFIPGLAFEALVRLRNEAYSANWLHRHRLACPVISIGNITMGGTGKTPLAIHVAQMLRTLGYTPALLSRGYGRLSGGTLVLPPGKKIPDPVSALGDEPALIQRRVPAAWIGISKNRFTAGRMIEQQKSVAFILDDGFQHRKLFRDLDIVVVDGSQGLESNRIFPGGTLREPISSLRRCHMIVVNGHQEDMHSMESCIRRLEIQAKIVRCEQRITSLIPFADWQNNVFASGGGFAKTAFAVAALGNPDRFLRDLRSFGIEVKGKRLFPDHYGLNEKDWKSCGKAAAAQGVDALVTTEKDAIKASHPPGFPLMVAIQSTEIFDDGALEEALQQCLGKQL